MNKLSLIDCAEKNDVEGIRLVLSSAENINQFEYDRSALHAACLSNAISAAEFLVERGINVNLKDHITGATPLHYCGVYNCFEIAQLILARNGNLGISDNYGNEPLWAAVFNVKGKKERLPLVELFLKHGADKNHSNKAGRSPLDFANQVKFQPTLEILAI